MLPKQVLYCKKDDKNGDTLNILLRLRRCPSPTLGLQSNKKKSMIRCRRC